MTVDIIMIISTNHDDHDYWSCSIIIMTHRIFASDGKVSVGRGGVVDRNGPSLNFVTPLSDMVMIMTHDHDYHYNCNYGNYGILYYYHVIN